MEYRVSADDWDRKVASLAAGLSDPMEAPPLIIEWRSGTLSIRDGNHRAAAMLMAGWTHCWIIVWCNSLADYEVARSAMDVTNWLPNSGTLSQQLRRDGWIRLPGSVDPSLVYAALSAIQDDLAHLLDPNRQVEYDNISYCPSLRGTAPILDLLTKSPAQKHLDDWLGWDKIGHDGGQIAIRRARNADRAYPPNWHMDGVGSGKNGLATDSPISNFTALVGVYLMAVEAAADIRNFFLWRLSDTGPARVAVVVIGRYPKPFTCVNGARGACHHAGLALMLIRRTGNDPRLLDDYHAALRTRLASSIP